jgi:hypothetical protein
MKKPNKAEIKEFLDGLQTRIRAVEKASSKLSNIEADQEALETKIQQIGEPHYTDDARITLLSVSVVKLAACKRAVEAHQVELGRQVVKLAPLIPQGGAMAREILNEVIGNRLETVTRAMLNFCLSRERAEKVAQMTDTCMGARNAADCYAALLNPIRPFSGNYLGAPQTEAEYLGVDACMWTDVVLTSARKIEAVLAEAISRAPDLLKFISSAEVADAGESEPEAVTVASEGEANATEV